ncbi:hypothetical protein C8R45DRAFT_87428 [Mycena sanguinolenta]|nr:hypothetical protein C8R45DRAFT_87428 [Mycena sanguinolenta]
MVSSFSIWYLCRRDPGPSTTTLQQLTSTPSLPSLPNLHMHPEFVLSRLSGLPLSLRRVAWLALDASTPAKMSDAVHQLHGLLLKYPDHIKYAANLLPVVYATLDPARLPEDTTPEPTRLHLVHCAIGAMALFTLHTLNFAVVHDLWTRVWAWIHFIDTHDYFPDESICGYSRLSLLKQLVEFLLLDRPELVFSTPDVCVFVAHAWASMVARDKVDHGCLFGISQALAACDDFPQCLEDVLEGAGGIRELGSLIITYIGLLVRDLGASDSGDSDSRCRLHLSLHRVLLFVSVPRPETCELALQTSLTKAGIITALTDALITLTSVGSLAGDAHRNSPLCTCNGCVTDLCMQKITSLLYVIQSPQLEKALNAGVLRAIVTGAVSNYRMANVETALKHFLGTILVGATRYYTFMRRLATALPEVLAIQPSRAFMDSPLWADWVLFLSLAQERLQFLAEFRERFFSTRSCANFECGVLIAQKTDLRRCAACRVRYYCSKECQMHSWRTQGHRAICIFAHDSGLGRQLEDHNNRFYNFTFLRDYQTRKPAILLQKLAHIHRTVNADFCVVMEFISGRCVPRVAPIEEWEYILERHPCMERSATGWREMHVVRFVDEDTLEFPWLLRCTSPAQMDGLVALARQIPKETDIVRLEKLCPALFEKLQKLANIKLIEVYC